MGEKCSGLTFIVNGILELNIRDQMGQIYTLEELHQGDIIGQYSVLFDQDLCFSARAKTSVRVLTLDQKFFVQFGLLGCHGDQNEIPGIDEAIERAQYFVDKWGVPVCDYKVYKKRKSKISPKERFRQAVRKTIILNKLNQKKNIFLKMLKDMRMRNGVQNDVASEFENSS